ETKEIMQSSPFTRLKKLIEHHADDIMIADYHRLLKPLQASTGGVSGDRFPSNNALARMQNKFDDSRRRVENRKRSIPLFDFPSELPITARQKLIIETIRDHPVVVITGETGSGKTTQ